MALESLARAAGHGPLSGAAPPLPRAVAEGALGEISTWLESTAAWLGLEAEPVFCTYPELDPLVRSAAPALLRVAVEGETGYLALLSAGRGSATLLGPDLRRRRLPRAAVVAALGGELEARIAPRVEAMLGGLDLKPARARAARAALTRELLGSTPVGGCWLLRRPPGARFGDQLRAARVPRVVGALLLSHGIAAALNLAAWWTLGRGALAGNLEPGWLLAWALLLLSMVPFRVLDVRLQGRVAIAVGALLKQRLLVGALRLDPDAVRHQGMGQLLGRVIESEAVETLALGGGLMAGLALLELAVAGFVLAQGAGGLLHTALLGGWILVALGLSLALVRARDRWTRARLDMTHTLVESMVGHRTRLSQEAPERWHDREDEALDRALNDARAMDRLSALAAALLPRGWLIVGLLGLAPAFVQDDASSAGLAVGVGGVFLALGALGALGGSVGSLGGAWIAWRQVAPLFAAAATPVIRGDPSFALAAPAAAADEPVVEATNLQFRYYAHGDPVLDGASIRLAAGERVLLEGPSGGGKSSLATLLVGLRRPESGLVLFRGLDLNTVGEAGLRRRVVAAPQYHENHVLAETFAFNLLMGRAWPPEDGDLEEAEALCVALGLGPLLARMPAGLMQMVGETGWQLSHGERSRLFLARALLQAADLVVLDESFAALDPASLDRALRVTLARAPALLVIAHP